MYDSMAAAGGGRRAERCSTQTVGPIRLKIKVCRAVAQRGDASHACAPRRKSWLPSSHHRRLLPTSPLPSQPLQPYTMPRSKRAKVVTLSKTEKKPGRENNERLFSAVRECVDNYPNIFVFSVDNMRNTYLKDVRSELSDSRYLHLRLLTLISRTNPHLFALMAGSSSARPK